MSCHLYDAIVQLCIQDGAQGDACRNLNRMLQQRMNGTCSRVQIGSAGVNQDVFG
jgi:hypothetical protein